MNALILAAAIAMLPALSSAETRHVEIDILHSRGERARSKRPCGDKVYEYLVKNVDALEAIVIAEDAMAIKMVGGRSMQVVRVVGTRGFLDVSDRMTLYFYVDITSSLVTIGIIQRQDAINRTDACSERWIGRGKKR